MMNASPPRRVLLVDDVPDLRRVVRLALERHQQFSIVGECADGHDAIQLAGELQPDVILLDLDMPRMGGLEALGHLRRVAPAAATVVLSGLHREPSEHLALSGGAVGFIEKGISPGRLITELATATGLLNLIQQVIDEGRLRTEADTTSPRVARRFVTDRLRGWEQADRIKLVELLVSELVTNAVMHASSPADVAVILRADVIRVEISDENPEFPQLRTVTPDSPAGRGLAMVSQIASAWGTSSNDCGGKVVWFEVERRHSDDEMIE